jgi:hypothetical protein
MSLIWADFPGGQRGLYGLDKNHIFNGIWAAAEGTFTSTAGYWDLQADPDGVSGGTVLRLSRPGNSSGAFDETVIRMSLGTTYTTVGTGFRLWLDALPPNDSNGGNAEWLVTTAANSVVAKVRVGASGQLNVYNSADTLLGSSATFPIVTNAWQHVETKVVQSATVGSVEVRVEGRVVLLLENLNLGANPSGNIGLGQDNAQNGLGRIAYYKDLIVWSGTGSEVNDFQGSVAVYDLVPMGDNSLNWTASTGSTGWNLIDDDIPANTLTCSGAILNNETVTMNSVAYKWTNASVDAGTPLGTAANPWLVTLGATAVESLENLFLAINATGVAGTDYSTALVVHPTIKADGYSAAQLDVVPLDGITTAATFSETGATLAWDNSSTFTGGPTDTSYISAADTLPAAAKFNMTDLPPDITSIRAAVSIGRMKKIDGGDCDMQMALSPNNTDWDSGTDRNITVADTWHWDVSHLSPATGVSWTPTEINNLIMRVDRTL